MRGVAGMVAAQIIPFGGMCFCVEFSFSLFLLRLRMAGRGLHFMLR